ncbi:MAG: hypothetical protein CL947_03270 [Epsilonproteobacteria bacterium]|nr:hypothetical protein [Campylobacterota bacterium]
MVPYDTSDKFDLVIILVQENDKSRLFTFNKETLLKNNVISNNHNSGKRALRVYPAWCKPTNKHKKHKNDNYHVF